MTYAAIALELGVSEPVAWRMIGKELDRLNQRRVETAERVQRLEIARLDQMLSGIWEQAKGGSFAAIDRVVKIMERRAKLLGLDLADKQAASTTGTVVLQVNEAIVVRREELTNGRTQESLPTPEPARLPPEQ
jgi:hypothetical protein